MASDSRHQCRDAVLQLRGHRQPEDLLLARAGPLSRQSGAIPSSFYQHTADSLELACVAKGEIRIVTPAEIFRLTRGKLLVIERGVYHAELLTLTGTGYRAYWYHLEKTYAHAAMHRRAPGGKLDTVGWELPGRTNVEGLASTIVRELAARDWDYPSAVAGVLEYLTCILVRRALRGAPSSQSPLQAPAIFLDPHESALIQAALDFCDAHYREGVTQADVARGVGYSSRYLSRLFSRHLGQSIARHLRNLRLTEAKSLLERTDLPVKAIAIGVGYPYPEHFSRAFTREVGVSPGDYRRRLDGS